MRALGLRDTHGILTQPGAEIQADSSALNWTDVFASIQKERPYEQSFAAVADHLMILHLDGFVNVDRWLGRQHEGRMVPAGGLFFMPGGMDFRVRLGDSLSTVHFYLGADLLSEVARDLVRGDPSRLELRPYLGGGDPLLEQIIIAVRQEMLAPETTGDGHVDYLARAAAARLIRKYGVAGADPVPAIARPGDATCKIARATDYVNANLHRSVALSELAAALSLSMTQLVTLFKTTLRQPPHRFIMGQRVVRARQMLAAGNLPIAEIALACGFSHQEHLTRIFKRETGLTPAAFRRASQN
jgi:AraC family transcriptional regulator